jgi:CTP synthase
LGLKSKKHDLKEWKAMARKSKRATEPVKIGIVGKYFGSGSFILEDSYISVIESVKHAAVVTNRKPVIQWLSSEQFEKGGSALKGLLEYDGIIVPGGFGSRGIEGKIAVIRYCRENKIPYFGLCYGMQLATIEFARHVAGMKAASTTEVDQRTPYPVIDIMPEQKQNLKDKKYGATMRLGAYPAVLKPETIAAGAYGQRKISERHRHRYEVNPEYINKLEKNGIVFSAKSPDGRLMEIMELSRSEHPFFLGTQFHPELKSHPLRPHPLFVEFMRAASKTKDRRTEIKSKKPISPKTKHA